MKYLISICFLILTVSCSQTVVVTDNEVRLSEFPLQIDSSEYAIIKDSFKIDEIEPAYVILGSLTPKFSMAFASKVGDWDSCLFTDGCMLKTAYSIILKDSMGFHQIKSADALKKYFAPIETKEEALSFACVASGLAVGYDFEIRPEYRTFVDTIRPTSSIPKENGYEVNLFDYELCGCGPHTHYMVRYFVTIDGNIKEIDRVKIYEDPEEDGLCVD